MRKRPVVGEEEGRFLQDLEVLEECRVLLLSGSPGKARMALILLDSLADALLYRRLERAYAASELEWWYLKHDNPSFPKSDRLSARKNFGERLRLARQPFVDLVYPRSAEQLVTDVEADVLLIGHSYRNAAYHRDTHNPAVIAPLGKVVFAAVVAVFERSHASGMFLRHSGEGVAALREGMEVPIEELAGGLADDLESRLKQVQEWREYLPLDEAQLGELLGLYEFYDKHGADDELLRLNELYYSTLREVNEGEPGPEAADALKLAESRVLARLLELRGSAGSPTVSLAALEKVAQAAEQLRRSRELGFILRTYKDADDALGPLEAFLEAAFREYDYAEQLQIDIERGK